MSPNKPEMQLFLSDARGIYIPRDFAQSIKRDCVTGVSAEDWEILENPDHEYYWETWDDVCRDAKITDPSNVVFTIFQDGGNCWLIPEGMQWDEESDCFAWPNKESEDSESES